MKPLREHAIDHALRGWHVFPLKPKSEEPLFADGLEIASSDLQQVKNWWDQYPDANIGIACEASRIVVLDIFGGDGLNSITRHIGSTQSPETLMVETGIGYHAYYSCGKVPIQAVPQPGVTHFCPRRLAGGDITSWF